MHHAILKPLQIKSSVLPVNQPHLSFAVDDDVVRMKIKMCENEGKGGMKEYIVLRNPPDLPIDVELVHEPGRELVIGSKRPRSLGNSISSRTHRPSRTGQATHIFRKHGSMTELRFSSNAPWELVPTRDSGNLDTA